MTDEPGKVFLVVMERGGIFGAYVDSEELATARAEAIEGVVVALPIAADFRPGSKET